jgi:hypothetical protein
MANSVLSDVRTFGQCWSRALTDVVWGQWLVLDTGLRAAQGILQAAAAPQAPPPARAAAEAESLINRAVARMRQGLAPPREIYQTPYRNRIDWSMFPDWARPNDPELYEGCSHEG